MTFQTLPLQFDTYGRARVRDEDLESPFDFVDEGRRQRAIQRERTIAELTGRPTVRELKIDPLTRVQIPLALHLILDFEQGRVLDSKIEGAELPIAERVVTARRASDAVHLTSRMRGLTGGAQSIAAAMALEMAGAITPPPLSIITRNLGACGELIADCARHLFLFAGPDYSESVVSRVNPQIWQRARGAAAPGGDSHGCETIAELMTSLNPVHGPLYLEALQISRLATEIATLVFGKSPHPSTVFPGGTGIEASRETFNLILGRINALLDYSKKIAAVWDDIVNFFYEVEPRYRRVGELPGNFLSVGLWDDHEAYDASYANCNEWGSRRYSIPGILIGCESRTCRLSDINIGIEEFVESAYYSDWDQVRFATDPVSNAISPRHPWNRESLLDPATPDLNGRYTWLSAPRWDREPMECGSIARLWINVANRHTRCEFITATRKGLEIEVPKGTQPAKRLNWNLPEKPNALERLRAGAYQIAFAGMVAYASLLSAFECLRRGETRMSTRFMLPDKSLGVGFWETGAGAITNHLVVKNQQITNYRIISPAEWMASSRDSSGTPGTIEAAILNTPILEEYQDDDRFTGIDALRVLRSFAL